MNLHETIKKYFDANFTAPDKPVYHYTKPEIADEIIKCGYLKLNSHHSLNKKSKDNEEIKRGVDIIRKILGETPSLSNYVPRFDEFIKGGIIFYTASFCREKKSSHALEKYGCTRIKLQPEILHRFSIDNRSSFFGNVEYKKLKQEKIIAEIIGFYMDKRAEFDATGTLFMWLITVIPLIKNENDEKDKECRVIQAEIWQNGKCLSPLCSKKLTFRGEEIEIY